MILSNVRFCKKYCALALAVFCLVGPGVSIGQTTGDALSFVRPEIGGVGRLLEPTRPTIQRPNQLMRMTPIRKDYLDDQISSFPLLLMSHRLGQVFAMLPNLDEQLSSASWDKKAFYDQEAEVRDPWHFKTFLLDQNTTVEFAPGKKTGLFRIKFPEGKPRRLLFGAYSDEPSWWDFSKDSILMAMQTYAVDSGHQPIKVYLYGRFNQSTKSGWLKDGKISYGPKVAGARLKAFTDFDPKSSAEVVFKYGVSLIDMDQAKRNFENELGSGADFDQVAREAKAAWSKVLGQIEVEGGSVAEKKSFYTALYRCYERMVDITEQGRYYSGYDNKVHSDSRPFYVDDWTWDTYIAAHPLRVILEPEVEQDMMQSYVRMYEQSGWMPTFPVVFGDHACMNGFHSSVMLLDVYRKGLRNFDVEKAYEGMLKNAKQATLLPWRNGPATSLDSFYHKHGYFPAVPEGAPETAPQVHPFEKRQSVAVSLGASYDDWAVGQLAAELGKYSDTALFAKRAKNYLNSWNKDKGFFLPKDENGHWIEVDPKFAGGMGGREFYDENNGWTYLWQVQQDVPGLMKLMGGKKGFENRLDQLFREDLGRSKYQFWAKYPDATGLVGQFSMGNEPSLFIPYLYNYTGSPWKTQNRVRLLLKTWFGDNVFGMPGDEDGGGMSAFVVFSSMGFYPIIPGTTTYAITSPLFSKSTIHLPNGKEFKVIADGCSEINKYIQSATLNGKVLNSPFIDHKDIVNGGVLHLELGSKPNKHWGVE